MSYYFIHELSSVTYYAIIMYNDITIDITKYRVDGDHLALAFAKLGFSMLKQKFYIFLKTSFKNCVSC